MYNINLNLQYLQNSDKIFYSKNEFKSRIVLSRSVLKKYNILYNFGQKSNDKLRKLHKNYIDVILIEENSLYMSINRYSI